MDGELIFDTEIDTSGFDKGVANVENKGANVGKTLAKSLEKAQKTVDDTKGKIKELESTLASLEGETRKSFEGLPTFSGGTEAQTINEMTRTALASNKEYQKAVTELDKLYPKLEEQEVALNNARQSCEQYANSVGRASEKVNNLSKNIKTESKANVVATANMRKAQNQSNGLEKSFAKLGKRLKRLAVAFLIATAIKATKESFQDLAQYSKGFNKSMSELQSVFLQARNSIATAFAPVLQALTPVIVSVTNAVISLFNAIAQVNAVLFKNSTTFTKAKKVTTDYAKSIKGAGKQADKSMASFDTINQLSGGTDSGTSTPSASEMFEEATVDEGVLSIFDRIQEKIQEMSDEFSKMWDETGLQSPFENWLIDVDTLSGSLSTLWDTVVGGLKEDFALIGDTISQMVEPIVSTWVEDILPIMTQVFNEIVKTLTVVFSTLNGVFQTIWKEGIEPALLTLIDIWTSVWDTIKDAWDTWGEPIFENIRTLIQNLGDTFQNLWDNILEPIWTNFINVVKKLWDEHLQPLFANLLDFIGLVINEGLNIINKWIIPIYNYLVKTFGPYISNFINMIINIVGEVAGTIADVISGVITNLKGIITFISGVFSGDWDKAWKGIVTSFEDIFNQVKGIVKGVINVIISLINAMINAIETSLNWIVDKINRIEITNPLTGDVIWSPSLPRFSFDRIPALASGTVVPANNGEFLAMLGDNKRETEIVSPLSTMKQAVREVLAEMGQQTLTATVPVYWNGEKIYEQVEKVKARRGGRLVKGGV